MCIGIFKESGVDLPTKEVLERCFLTNSDGAGYGIYDYKNEVWNVKKGFMKWKHFWKSFKKENLAKDDKCAIHFRIGTSGKKTNNKNIHPDCTHPFPISSLNDLLMSNSYKSDSIIMHNGVWGSGEDDLSDTMVAIRDVANVLLPYLVPLDEKKNEKLMNILGHCLKDKNNRWFIGYKDDVLLFGEWIQDKDTKIWYSNDKYKPVTIYRYPHNNVYWGNHYPANNNRNTVMFETIYYHKKEFKDYMQNGVWSWKVWDFELKNKSNSSDDKIFEIFDNNNKLIGMVDIYGNSIWGEYKQETHNTSQISNDLQDLIEKKGDMYEVMCVQCGNRPFLHSIRDNDGECPHCFEILFPKDSSGENNYSEQLAGFCPSCNTDNTDNEYVFEDDFYYTCYTCGKIYDSCGNTYHNF